MGYRNLTDAQQSITEYIVGYSSQTRPHQQNRGLSPNAVEGQYWLFNLSVFITSFVLAFVDMGVGWFNDESGMGVLCFIFFVLTTVPSLGVTFRRLHDIGRNAWWLLIVLVPLVGVIVLFAFMCLDSNPGNNKFRKSPKEMIDPLPVAT